MAIENILREIAATPHAQTGVGATDDEIAFAEGALGKLPSDYKTFLRRLGWLEMSARDCYGLGSDVPRNLDVVRMTMSERTEPYLRLPKHFVTIHNDGAGNHIFDTSAAGTAEEGVIFFWDHEMDEDQHPDAIHSSLEVMLTDLLGCHLSDLASE